MGMSKMRAKIQKHKSKSLLRRGSAPQIIEGYIARRPEDTRTCLRQINETIHNTLLDAIQKILWSMPTYWKKRNLIQFVGFKNISVCIPLL